MTHNPTKSAKTSTPGSNPGGASKSNFKHEKHFRPRWVRVAKTACGDEAADTLLMCDAGLVS
jgi:hypothetical protein